MAKPSGQYRSRLSALTSAALALSGVFAPFGAIYAAAPTDTAVSYRYSHYQEPDLETNDVVSGSTDRYTIDAHLLAVSGPLGAGFGYSLMAQGEILSGALPLDTELNEDDGTVDVVMSGASIEEQRIGGTASLGYYFSRGSVALNTGFSTEDDYQSTRVGLSGDVNFNNKQTVVGYGLSQTSDVIDPEDDRLYLNSEFPILPGEEGVRDISSYYLSVSRVLTPSSQVQFGLSYTQRDGYLHDPYMRIDRRPETRNEITYQVSYRRYIDTNDSAVHFDYRYFEDNWGIDSYTTTIAVYRNIKRLQLIPSIRHYLQTGATFYTPYQPTDAQGDLIRYNYQSNDARLSDFGAFSVGMKARLTFGDFVGIFGTEYYKASQEYSPGRSDFLANPSLVEFFRVTVGFDYTF